MVQWRSEEGAILLVFDKNDIKSKWLDVWNYHYNIPTHLLNSSTDVVNARCSLVEAYFAMAVEGWLSCSSQADSTISKGKSLGSVYEEFLRVSPCFDAHFVVYQHFRKRGWILRSGLNYGGHFVLYRGGINQFHSEYIVYISDSKNRVQWHVLQALTRIAEDVKKTIIVCEVSEVASNLAVTEHKQVLSQVLVTDQHSDPYLELHGQYDLGGNKFLLDAILFRYWDVAAIDEKCTDYSFAPQSTTLKHQKRRITREKTSDHC